MQYERQRDCLVGEQLHCVQKSGGKVWYMKEINKNILDNGRFFMFGTGNRRSFATFSANLCLFIWQLFSVLQKAPRKLHGWFIGTTLYKKNLDSFVRERAMTMRTN